MAGLAATELGVRGAARSRPTRCARSGPPRCFRARSLYLAARGVRDVSMAVVFQVVVPADAAGVAFTAPPRGVHGGLFRADEMLVNAAFGLGAPVVDGAATPDVVSVDRATGAVRRVRGRRKASRARRRANGLEHVAIDASQRARTPALEPWALARLAELARALEALEPKRAARCRVRRRDPSASGSSRRARRSAAASPTAATQKRCGRAPTSARRCPARRRRSPGRSRARSPRRASARRSPRSAARFRAAFGWSPTCTAVST